MQGNADFQRRLKAALGSMKNGAVKGVRLACAHVKLESQKRMPVDEGNLKASAYSDVSSGSRGITGVIGYTAEYAAAVHEMEVVNKGVKRKGKGAKGKYWDPQSTAGNKFLEKAFDENHSEILEIIHKSAKL